MGPESLPDADEEFLHLLLCSAKIQYEKDVDACDPALEIGLGSALKHVMSFLKGHQKATATFKQRLNSPQRCIYLCDSGGKSENVIQNRSDCDDFRRTFLYVFDVDAVIRVKVPLLKNLFARFARSVQGIQTDDKLLSLERWLALLGDRGLLNSVCTPQRAALCFEQALPVQSLALELPDAVQLYFPNFLEAIARLAYDGAIVPCNKALLLADSDDMAEFYGTLDFAQQSIPSHDIWALFASLSYYEDSFGGVTGFISRLDQLLNLIAPENFRRRVHRRRVNFDRPNFIQQRQRYLKHSREFQAAILLEQFIIGQYADEDAFLGALEQRFC